MGYRVTGYDELKDMGVRRLPETSCFRIDQGIFHGVADGEIPCSSALAGSQEGWLGPRGFRFSHCLQLLLEYANK